MHQRLAARENYPAHSQRLNIAGVMFEIGDRKLLYGVNLPDVAHQTTAIAAAVWVQDQDRQVFYDVRV